MVTEVLTTFEAFDFCTWSKDPQWVRKQYTTWYEDGKLLTRQPKNFHYEDWKNYRNVKHWTPLDENDLKNITTPAN